MATKLHALLAVKNDVDNQASKCRQELMTTFEKKRHHFEETRTTFKSNKEGEQAVIEAQKDIQTTVAQEIEWISKHIASALDVNYQIDLANSQAKADVILDDGSTLLKAVPGTNLLQLQRRLAEIKQLVDSIPTLDPAKGFRPDSNKGRGIYKAREVNKTRTKKEQKILVLYPATDKHPAQTQLVAEDIPVGTIQELEWSALITPAMKSDILERVEELTRAVKKALARANELEMEVAGNVIGKKILDYVFAPLNTPEGTSTAAAAD